MSIALGKAGPADLGEESGRLRPLLLVYFLLSLLFWFSNAQDSGHVWPSKNTHAAQSLPDV